MHKRFFIKLIASMLSAVIVVFVVMFLISYISSIGTDFSHPAISLSIASVAALVASITVVIWGLPIHLTLNKYGYTSIHWYALAGFIPGFIFVFGFEPFGQDPFYSKVGSSVFCGLIGCVAAISSWYILYKRYA